MIVGSSGSATRRLSATVHLVMVKIPLFTMPPPAKVARLRRTVEPVTVILLALLIPAPLPPRDTLSLAVQLLINIVPAKLKTPSASLLHTVQLEGFTVPPLTFRTPPEPPEATVR